MTDDEVYPELYLQGIRYFNECEFFEAHEAWEELWTDYQGPLRKFYQGLIQVAVALHHFVNGNIRGARKLYVSSSNYLQPYRPVTMGLDIDRLLAEFERCFGEVLSSEEQFPQVEIDPDLIPDLQLDSPPPPGQAAETPDTE